MSLLKLQNDISNKNTKLCQTNIIFLISLLILNILNLDWEGFIVDFAK